MGRRSFEYYCLKTMPSMSVYFVTSLWDRLVLQMSRNEPAIRHAIIAVGALHEKMQVERQGKIAHMYHPSSLDTAFPLSQYNLALSSLQKLLGQVNDKASLETALMCCLVCICFETMQQNYEKVLWHLDSCLKVFEKPKFEVDPHIMRSFVRLDALAASMGGRRPQTPSDSSFMNQITPAIFVKFEDARDSLTREMLHMYSFMRDTADHYRYREPGDVPIWAIAESQKLVQRLKDWNTAFEGMLSARYHPQIEGHESQRKILRMQYLTTLITISTCLHAEESTYDAFDTEFETIVTTASSFLLPKSKLPPATKSPSQPSIPTVRFYPLQASRKRSNSISTQPTFTFTLDGGGVMHPLIITSLRCRHSPTRHRALDLIHLIATSRTLVPTATLDGGWDAVTFITVASRVIAIEEEGFKVEEGETVPEYRRVHALNTPPIGDQMAKGMGRAGWLTLTTTRLLNGADGGWDVRVEWVKVVGF